MEEAERGLKELPKRKGNPKLNWNMPVKKELNFLSGSRINLVLRAFFVVAALLSQYTFFHFKLKDGLERTRPLVIQMIIFGR